MCVCVCVCMCVCQQHIRGTVGSKLIEERGQVVQSLEGLSARLRGPWCTQPRPLGIDGDAVYTHAGMHAHTCPTCWCGCSWLPSQVSTAAGGASNHALLCAGIAWALVRALCWYKQSCAAVRLYSLEDKHRKEANLQNKPHSRPLHAHAPLITANNAYHSDIRMYAQLWTSA